MRLSPGARFGSHEILAEIGAGGMGEVYRARDSKLARDVAIKVLPALFTDDAERLARFRREAQVLAAAGPDEVLDAPQFGFGPPETYARMPRLEPSPGSTRRNADTTPDGRILGVLRQSDSQSPTVTTPQLTVVLNWFEDLRRRVR